MLRSDIGAEKRSEKPEPLDDPSANGLIDKQILLYCDILFTFSASDTFAFRAVFEHKIKSIHIATQTCAVFCGYDAFFFYY